MSKRRKVLIALGAYALGTPVASLAQQKPRIPIVAVLALDTGMRVTLLREGLRRLGYDEGRNIRIENRIPKDRAQVREIADKFVRDRVDVIVTIGFTTTDIARKATSTIPIVMMTGVDPVRTGVAASLSRPGGNVTGITTLLLEVIPKRFEMAREAIPGLTRVGVLVDPTSEASGDSLRFAREAAKRLGLQLHVAEAGVPEEIEKALTASQKAGVGVFLLGGSTMLSANKTQLLEIARKLRLPGIFTTPDWAEGGGFMAYGVNDAESFRLVAAYVDKILKGAKPADLPIEQPTKFELIINLKTAKALGLTIPQPFLMRADRVIE